MTNSSRADWSRRRIRRMQCRRRRGAASVIAQARSGTPLSVFAVVGNGERRCPETLRLPDRANTDDEWICQQALKFHHVALIHLDTAFSLNDIDGARSVALLRGLEPIGKISDVRARLQGLQDCALSGLAVGDHAHSEGNNSEIFSRRHRLIHST
jgi:hypothetical protein